MRILVLGAGMYVTGRGGTVAGTVLSSIAETSRTLPVRDVLVVARSDENKGIVRESVSNINESLGTALQIRYMSNKGEGIEFLRGLLKKNHFDCAVIVLPDHLHYPFAKSLLMSGVHCLVVKPLTARRSEAIDLLGIQKRNKLLGVVEFHKRYDEANLFVKKCLGEKQLGKLLYFTVDFSQRVNIPLEVFRGWATKTNVFQYLGVHYVDLIFFLTEFRPVRLTATGTYGLLVSEGINNFDSIHAKILWQNPNDNEETFVSIFNTNWVDPRSTSAMSDQKYKVVGTMGRIECDQKNRGIEWVQENVGIRHINPYFSEYLPSPNGLMEFTGYGYRSISLFLRDVDRIKRKEISPDQLEGFRPTFSQALVSTSVLDAVNRSLENGSNWIAVDDLPG